MLYKYQQKMDSKGDAKTKKNLIFYKEANKPICEPFLIKR